MGTIGGADGPSVVYVASAFSVDTVLWLLLAAVLAYLMGSLDFGIIVSKYLYHDDIRHHGSGNAGTTNILHTFGKKAAALTVIGDIGKGVLATVLGRWLLEQFCYPQFGIYGAYLAAFCAVCGHLWPVWFGFKGGKGVATAAGAILATAPAVFLGLAVVFFGVVLTTRIVSLSSISAAVAYPVLTALWCLFKGSGVMFPTCCAIVMAALVIWMHRTNIKRLRNGTEYKFGEKKK